MKHTGKTCDDLGSQ